MERSPVLTIATTLMSGILLLTFGTVSAAQNDDHRKMENSPLAIVTTPTPFISKSTPIPKASLTPLATKPASLSNMAKEQNYKPDTYSVQLTTETTGSWQLVTTEGFESVFPSTGWTVRDLYNDPCRICWDDALYWDGTAYRAHSGSWGAWPASGGTDGYPPSTINSYANNMNTRMIYGPFDLSNAGLADADFYLWREIEPGYDYLAFEVSHTGNANDFQELARWDGSEQQWAFQDIYFNNYIGDNSVWIAWRFYSDSSMTYQGPWVDDIRIWKYVPGQVTARGSLSYMDRDGVTSRPARFTKVYLYNWDVDGYHDLVAGPFVTDNNGFIQFPTLTNWDVDDSDLNPYNRQLDLYAIWETDVNDATNVRRRVTNINVQAYAWSSAISTNAYDRTIDFSSTLPRDWPNLQAMWIFQDLRRAWEYVRNNSNPLSDPGSVTARWELNRNDLFPCTRSCFYGGIGSPYIFIAHGDSNSPDQVTHEVGHHYMYNATQWWWWHAGCWNHNFFVSTDVNCTWSEGWAYFFPLPVNGDQCIDFGPGPCGTGNLPFVDLETPTWGDNRVQGDTVEGRVSGALYDLWDPSNESNYDSATFGFAPIWSIVRNAPHETTFLEFWNSWKTSGNNKHHAVRAIYQNTVDYDTAPVIAGLPDLTMPKNSIWNNAIDLWSYSYDSESQKSELGWQILAVTDPRCGVTFDGRYVDLAPQTGWFGSCDVTVSVSDSIKANTDVFRLRVDSAWRFFLPIIVK